MAWRSEPMPSGCVVLWQRALLTLPARDRETLLLYAWADLSYSEIAAALQIPIGTVRSRLNRARRTLRRQIDIPNNVTLIQEKGSSA
jgi:DNA-directed RNA polymerase specialized sigma24 family protein